MHPWVQKSPQSKNVRVTTNRRSASHSPRRHKRVNSANTFRQPRVSLILNTHRRNNSMPDRDKTEIVTPGADKNDSEHELPKAVDLKELKEQHEFFKVQPKGETRA